MNLPTQPGRYIGQPTKWAVNQTGPNNLDTFVCEFSLNEFLDGADWIDISGHGHEITGYFYLFKKDGQPNDFTLDSLEAALGWDGVSIPNLDNGEWGDVEVQLTVNEEEYRGKRSMKIAFINPRDWQGGGPTKADPQYVQSLDQKYGALLRARKGAPAPKPAPKTAPPPKSASPARERAWDAFKEAHPGLSVTERAAQWRNDLAAMFPGKAQDQVTDAEWIKAASRFKSPATAPFGDEQQFKEDDIPF